MNSLTVEEFVEIMNGPHTERQEELDELWYDNVFRNKEGGKVLNLEFVPLREERIESEYGKYQFYRVGDRLIEYFLDSWGEDSPFTIFPVRVCDA